MKDNKPTYEPKMIDFDSISEAFKNELIVKDRIENHFHKIDNFLYALTVELIRYEGLYDEDKSIESVMINQGNTIKTNDEWNQIYIKGVHLFSFLYPGPEKALISNKDDLYTAQTTIRFNLLKDEHWEIYANLRKKMII